MRDTEKTVHALTSQYGTSCPFTLCECMGIQVLEQELPHDVNGFCVYLFQRYVIVLNDRLHGRIREAVCAHELGHIILHGCVNSLVLKRDTHFYLPRYEHEADFFCACLLLDSRLPEWAGEHDTLTIEQVSALSGLPESLVKLRFNRDVCA